MQHTRIFRRPPRSGRPYRRLQLLLRIECLNFDHVKHTAMYEANCPVVIPQICLAKRKRCRQINIVPQCLEFVFVPDGPSPDDLRTKRAKYNWILPNLQDGYGMFSFCSCFHRRNVYEGVLCMLCCLNKTAFLDVPVRVQSLR